MGFGGPPNYDQDLFIVALKVLTDMEWNGIAQAYAQEFPPSRPLGADFRTRWNRPLSRNNTRDALEAQERVRDVDAARMRYFVQTHGMHRLNALGVAFMNTTANLPAGQQPVNPLGAPSGVPPSAPPTAALPSAPAAAPSASPRAPPTTPALTTRTPSFQPSHSPPGTTPSPSGRFGLEFNVVSPTSISSRRFQVQTPFQVTSPTPAFRPLHAPFGHGQTARTTEGYQPAFQSPPNEPSHTEQDEARGEGHTASPPFSPFLYPQYSEAPAQRDELRRRENIVSPAHLTQASEGNQPAFYSFQPEFHNSHLTADDRLTSFQRTFQQASEGNLPTNQPFQPEFNSTQATVDDGLTPFQRIFQQATEVPVWQSQTFVSSYGQSEQTSEESQNEEAATEDINASAQEEHQQDDEAEQPPQFPYFYHTGNPHGYGPYSS